MIFRDSCLAQLTHLGAFNVLVFPQLQNFEYLVFPFVFRPVNVGNCESQFGHTNRKLLSVWSFRIPLM